VFKVKKRDGSLQDFDRNKVFNSLMQAGGSQEEAEKVTKDVEAWLPNVAVEGVVDSQAIRAKVIGLLGPLNPTVAGDYEAFKKQY
jgi:transcriptional regulator NrdR family protein